MKFSHPHARQAKVWNANFPDGTIQRLLVVVTTLELDPLNDRYKGEMVQSLSLVAQEHIIKTNDADGFVLINRVRDWDDQT